MDYKISGENLQEFYDSVDELEKILTSMIVDLNEARGYVQARICYIYYRRLLWEAKRVIINGVRECKTKKQN